MDELRVSGAFLRWYCGSFRILNLVQWPTDFGAERRVASMRARRSPAHLLFQLKTGAVSLSLPLARLSLSLYTALLHA